MADYDNRRDYRGGGGGGFNRKRKRFREDDDFNHRNQRPRHSAPPPGSQLKKGLVRIPYDSQTRQCFPMSNSNQTLTNAFE